MSDTKIMKKYIENNSCIKVECIKLIRPIMNYKRETRPDTSKIHTVLGSRDEDIKKDSKTYGKMSNKKISKKCGKNKWMASDNEKSGTVKIARGKL